MIFSESKRVINLFIDELWSKQKFVGKFVDFKVDTWFSARMQQCLGKQAFEIVKSQRKKKKKNKPIFDRDVINLDSRFFDVKFDLNSFDVWIKIQSIGDKIIIKLPSKKHKHFLKFSDWDMKKSIRLRKTDSGIFADLYFEKQIPELKSVGEEIGLDCGYKKLLVSSDGEVHDVGLEKTYEKISRKQQGSNRFKKALVERDNKINQSINSIDFNNLKTIVVEDLKNVKHKSKGKIRKTFNKKLQRWSYSKVLDRLSNICEQFGINFIRIDPRHTSQICSSCGFKHKNNRNGELFKCLSCGFEADADFNASVNILHRGVYSPATALL